MVENEHIAKEIIARKLAIGQVLDVEIQDAGKNRFQTPLIGLKNGKYLIAELPSLTRHGNLRDQLFDNQQVIVRTICEVTTGECLGFKSYLLAKLKQPEQLLFLSFPTDVQIHELRGEHRMLVIIKAQLFLEHGQHVIYGLLTDLSAGGCRFEYAEGMYEPPCKDEVVEVCFEHPENGQEQKYKAKICSVRGFQNLVSLGMSFEKELKRHR